MGSDSYRDEARRYKAHAHYGRNGIQYLEKQKMESKSNSQRIIYLKWDNKEHIKAVSNLHIQLLPESILSKLGYLFLAKFYYTKLIKNNLIDVYLYKQEKQYVGFISCTNEPFSFMRDGMKGNLILLLWILGLSIVLKPSRIFILAQFISKNKKDVLMKNLQEEYNHKMGEFLSFGVLENYRKIIDHDEKISISNALMKHVFTHFNANNIQFGLLRILATNQRAIKFYKKHGGYIIPSDNPNQVIILISTQTI